MKYTYGIRVTSDEPKVARIEIDLPIVVTYEDLLEKFANKHNFKIVKQIRYGADYPIWRMMEGDFSFTSAGSLDDFFKQVDRNFKYNNVQKSRYYAAIMHNKDSLRDLTRRHDGVETAHSQFFYSFKSPEFISFPADQGMVIKPSYTGVGLAKTITIDPPRLYRYDSDAPDLYHLCVEKYMDWGENYDDTKNKLLEAIQKYPGLESNKSLVFTGLRNIIFNRSF